MFLTLVSASLVANLIYDLLGCLLKIVLKFQRLHSTCKRSNRFKGGAN